MPGENKEHVENNPASKWQNQDLNSILSWCRACILIFHVQCMTDYGHLGISTTFGNGLGTVHSNCVYSQFLVVNSRK